MVALAEIRHPAGVDADGEIKYHAIDDGSAANTNDMAATEIQVHTTSVDAVACICRHMHDRWVHWVSMYFPDTQVEAGVEDEASAFRFKPTSDLDTHLLVVAAYHPGQRKMIYYMMYGHPFGIGPAVTNYNRGSEFAMHITRCLFMVLRLHFYDDALLLGFSYEAGSAQYSYTQLHKCLGTLLDPKKAQRMSTNVNYIWGSGGAEETDLRR